SAEYISIAQSVVRMIENVKEIGLHLHKLGFGKMNVFRHGQIKRHKSRRCYAVSTQVSSGARACDYVLGVRTYRRVSNSRKYCRPGWIGRIETGTSGGNPCWRGEGAGPAI